MKNKSLNSSNNCDGLNNWYCSLCDKKVVVEFECKYCKYLKISKSNNFYCELNYDKNEERYSKIMLEGIILNKNTLEISGDFDIFNEHHCDIVIQLEMEAVNLK